MRRRCVARTQSTPTNMPAPRRTIRDARGTATAAARVGSCPTWPRRLGVEPPAYNGNGHHAAPATRTTEYQVRATDGALKAIHIRRDGPTGKAVSWCRPDRTAGLGGLGGLRTRDLPMYGSERLKDADNFTAIVLVEGEKCADALAAKAYADSRPGRPRRGGPRLTDRTLTVALGSDLYRRLDAAAKRYNCAAGMVARYAIEHGMKGALARLRRELPPDQWPSAAPEATEAAERG